MDSDLLLWKKKQIYCAGLYEVDTRGAIAPIMSVAKKLFLLVISDMFVA